MPQIRPITELRNTNVISELCHETQEPIYITKNGHGDLVVMSLDLFEKLFEKATQYISIAQAEYEIATKEKMSLASEVFGELRSKHAK
jgi:PHD/YefM family antitoxin component YafN of YafNO toxin-antitoxin module